jgi:hypothetical protein
MPVTTHTRYNGSYAVSRGPLIYSLGIEPEWKQMSNGTPYPDWETRPASPWNYGLIINSHDPESSFHVIRNTPGDAPFSSRTPPVEIRCRGKRIAGWGISKNAAEPPPRPPFETEGAPEELVLVPYGCAKLRLTEMPVISDND